MTMCNVFSMRSVFVRMLKSANQSPGGLFLHEQSQNTRTMQLGEVVGVGPGRLDEDLKRVPLDVCRTSVGL